MNNPFVKIYSHPRSGTHFLGTALKKTFYDGVDTSIPGTEWGHWSNRKQRDELPFGKLFGNHFFPGQKTRLPAIYLFRDGRSVALSIYKSENFINSDMKRLSFSEFLHAKLDWLCSPSVRVEPKENIIQHWYNHVSRWHAFKKMFKDTRQLYFLRYENLLTNYYVELEKISDFFELQFVKIVEVEELVGPSPNFKNHLDQWKEFFSEDDIEYFYSFVSIDSQSQYLWKTGE